MGFTAVWVPRTEALLRRIEHDEVKQQLDILSQSLTPYLLQRQYAAVYETLDSIVGGQSNWVAVILTRPDGRRVYPLSAIGLPEGSDVIIAKHDVVLRGQVYAHLTVAVDFSERMATLRRQNRDLAIMGVGLLLSSLALLAYVVGKLVGRPIRQLSDAAVELAEGNYDARLPMSRGDEIGILTESFAKMRSRIQANNAEIEEARRQAEHAAGTKARFLATMSHEIRTPLNGMVPVAELLLETDLTPAQRKFGETIRSSGRALLSIVNDILDISKLDAGAYVVRRADFDIEQLVQGVVDILDVRARSQRTTLGAEIAPIARGYFNSDPDRIRQVLVNLAGNAVKFTQDGSVTIKVTIEEPSVGKQQLRISVEDTGIGIPSSEIERVFESFSQVESGFARRFEGSGLGLYISKTIVAALGGEIGVESVLGQGSRFWFTVPVERASAPVPAPSATRRPAGPRRVRKVLLADDNELNRIVGKAMLDGFGAETQVVSDGAEALAAIESGDFDLVLMDVNMPRMNGLSATRAIRGLGPDKRGVRVVALTGSVMADERQACFDAGMDDYMSKPLSKSEIRRVLGN